MLKSRHVINPHDTNQTLEYGQILLESYWIGSGKKLELSEPSTSEFIESIFYPFHCRLDEKGRVMINKYFTGLIVQQINDNTERVIFAPDFCTIDSDLMDQEYKANFLQYNHKELNLPANR